MSNSLWRGNAIISAGRMKLSQAHGSQINLCTLKTTVEFPKTTSKTSFDLLMSRVFGMSLQEGTMFVCFARG